MQTNWHRFGLCLALCFTLPLLQGCTKEKAEAIKVAAENFRGEAFTALEQIRVVLKQNTAMPPREDERLADYAAYQAKLLKEGVISTKADLAEMRELKKEIDSAAQYQKLAAALLNTIACIAKRMA